MKLLSAIESFQKMISDKLMYQRLIINHVMPVAKKYKQLPQKRTLTRSQAREVRAYWKRLTGKRVPLIWHKFMYSRRGEFHVNYMPTSLFRISLIYRANQYGYKSAYADKNMLDVYLPDVKHPKVILRNMNGYFYIGKTAVSREEAIAHCQNLSGCLIKPTLQSHGDGVRKLQVINGVTSIEGLTVAQLFDRYKKNFCVQEFVHQHEAMSALNPSSVNTIRVVTYRSGMEVLVVYTVVRIGRSGSEIDNESAGGISTIINKDGTLGKYAYGRPGVDKVEKTDSGVVLEGYKIPSYDKALEMVKQQHLQLPFFDIIGWDVAIDEDAEPVLIEWNITPELSQSANGPALGEYTERIVTELMKRENNRNKRW